MQRFPHSALFGLAVSAAVGLAGCGNTSLSDGTEASSPGATADSHEGHEHGDHAHSSEGPHHGELIELGSEAYHAELLHDEQAKTVTIYVLDGQAGKQVPIEAKTMTINAKLEGAPVQFSLEASPDEHDPQGMSSRFVSYDEQLADHLDDEGADFRLVLAIEGKSYRGVIAHDHDHEHDHNHEH